jgi:hypothetical protein
LISTSHREEIELPKVEEAPVLVLAACAHLANPATKLHINRPELTPTFTMSSPAADPEKGPVVTPATHPAVLPDYNTEGRSKDAAETVQDEDFMTRNGLNLTSFKKRDYGLGLVELDRAMKSRHLHMIAIGGSIGAGFFVGSGNALYKGVSFFSLSLL